MDLLITPLVFCRLAVDGMSSLPSIVRNKMMTINQVCQIGANKLEDQFRRISSKQ